jgi:hypothetical protein
MSDIISKIDTEVHGPGVIKKDEPAYDFTWTDSRGRVRGVKANLSPNANMEAALGPNYLRKFAGTLFESAVKTAASLYPAGSTWKMAIALTGAKIVTKSAATAGNYIITGEYDVKTAVKKALIINAVNPSNVAPILNSKMLENTVLGQTYGSYYGFVNGNGKSTNFFQKNRPDYIDIKAAHLHGTIYSLNPLAQAEAQGGYSVYNMIYGKHPHETAHANQIHNNDNQHTQMVNNMHYQGAGQQGFNVVPNPASGLNVNLHVFDEPKSGGEHDEGEYVGAYLPFSVQATRELTNYFENNNKEGMARTEAGIAKDNEIWVKRINNADGVLSKTGEIIKGIPTALDNLDKISLVYANRYFAVPVLSTVAGGFNEAVIAIDKSIEAVVDYSLAAAHSSMAGWLQIAKAAFGPVNGAPMKNPYEEVQVITDSKGVKTTRYISKVRQDNVKVGQPIKPKLLIDVKNQQNQADDAFRKLMGWDTNKLANIMNPSGAEQRAAQSAIYGAAGKPNAKFSGYTGFGSPIPNIAGVGIQRNATKGPTISQTRK